MSQNTKPAPRGSQSVRENVSWILQRARYAIDAEQVDKHPEEVKKLLAGIVDRAGWSYDALDTADKALNEWSAMTGPQPGI